MKCWSMGNEACAETPGGTRNIFEITCLSSNQTEVQCGKALSVFVLEIVDEVIVLSSERTENG